MQLLCARQRLIAANFFYVPNRNFCAASIKNFCNYYRKYTPGIAVNPFYFFTSFLLTITFSNLNAQAPTIQWMKDYGADSKSIEITGDNGYVVVGSSYSYQGSTEAGHGGKDAWVTK